MCPASESEKALQVGWDWGSMSPGWLIERHQGQVGISSAPGQGATFWFTLPLERQEQGGAEPHTQSNEDSSSVSQR